MFWAQWTTKELYQSWVLVFGSAGRGSNSGRFLSFLLIHVLRVNGHNQLVDYSTTFREVWQAKKGLCLSLLQDILDTKVSGVHADTARSGRSFQSFIVAGKKDVAFTWGRILCRFHTSELVFTLLRNGMGSSVGVFSTVSDTVFCRWSIKIAEVQIWSFTCLLDLLWNRHGGSTCVFLFCHGIPRNVCNTR